MEVILQDTQDFARQYYASDHSGHDFTHIQRVYSNACELLKSYPEANAFVVKMATLLHDVDDYKMHTDGQVTLRYLQQAKVDPELIAQILRIIGCISFSKSGSHPSFDDLESKILSDADKLDAIGAIGICRTIMYSMAFGNPLFNPDIRPRDNFSMEECRNLPPGHNTAINHFFEKLLKLKGAIQTEVAKQWAERRHAFMIEFLRQFFQEQHLDDWLDYLEQYLAKS